jgi:hypothetical protein
MGPPLTRLTLDPPASTFDDGYYIDVNTRIELTATTEDPGGIQAIFADVDVHDPPLPTSVYTGPFSLADLGLTTPGAHRLRFYAQEVSGTVEQLKTVTLYTSTALTTERQITNRPNPFRAGQESTIVLFHPASSGPANVTIYDLFGGVVFNRQIDVSAEGTAQFVWDGTNGSGNVVANGGYICRISGHGYELRRKIAVLK